MSEWITDRLPTFDEAIGYTVLKWHKEQPCAWPYNGIKLGEPWQPIPRPAPYVKPKRWTVEWCGSTWILRDNRQKCSYMSGLAELGRNGGDAAQRIADAFNEVIP